MQLVIPACGFFGRDRAERKSDTIVYAAKLTEILGAPEKVIGSDGAAGRHGEQHSRRQRDRIKGPAELIRNTEAWRRADHADEVRTKETAMRGNSNENQLIMIKHWRRSTWITAGGDLGSLPMRAGDPSALASFSRSLEI